MCHRDLHKSEGICVVSCTSYFLITISRFKQWETLSRGASCTFFPWENLLKDLSFLALDVLLMCFKPHHAHLLTAKKSTGESVRKGTRKKLANEKLERRQVQACWHTKSLCYKGCKCPCLYYDLLHDSNFLDLIARKWFFPLTHSKSFLSTKSCVVNNRL